MSESKNSLLSDVITPVSDAIHQNLPETEKQADGALSTVVGFFNNVVLYPVKKANLTFHYKLEAFEDDLKEKIKNVPVENLQVPPMMIAGPTLEALRYTYDEAELREMYENLLASAMDNRIASEAHPAFVDAIRQMTPLEARMIQIFAVYNQIPCATILFCISGTTKTYFNAMPNYFVPELTNLADPFMVSAAITNLARLGFLNIMMYELKNTDYESFRSHPYVIERRVLFESYGEPFSLKLNKCFVAINDYGIQFAKVCLSGGDNNAD